MPRKQKSIEERLAENKQRQDQLKAKLHMLEVKKRQRDSRTRGKAEMTLMRVVIDQMAATPEFKSAIAELVKKTKLRPDEQEAIAWLMSSLDPPTALSVGDKADPTATVQAKAQNVA